MTSHGRRVAVVCGLALALVGCGGSAAVDELLHPGGGGNTTGRVTVDVTPGSAQIAPRTRQTFTATVTGATETKVNWSVAEGSTGGTISSDGVYLAPETEGSYTVVATSKADSTATGRVTVTVKGIGGTAKLKPGVRVLPADGSVSVRQFDGNTIIVGGNVPEMQTQDILLTGLAGGVLGQVRGVTDHAGDTSIQLTPAPLEDAVQEGTLTLTLPGSQAAYFQAEPGIQMAAGRASGFSDLLLHATAQPTDITVSGLKLDYHPDLTFTTVYQAGRLQSLKLNAVGELAFSGRATFVKPEQGVTGTDTARLLLGRIVYPSTVFADLPAVYLRNELDFYLGAEVNGSLRGTLAHDFDVHSKLNYGANYRQLGGWSPIFACTSTASSNVQTLQLNNDGTTRLFIEVEWVTHLQNAAGPVIRGQVDVQHSAHVNWAKQTFERTLTHGLQFTSQSDAGCWKKGLVYNDLIGQSRDTVETISGTLAGGSLPVAVSRTRR